MKIFPNMIKKLVEYQKIIIKCREMFPNKRLVLNVLGVFFRLAIEKKNAFRAGK